MVHTQLCEASTESTTLTYYKTSGDILKVKYLLGHKRLDTTGRYAHYQAFRNEYYIVKRPQTKKEKIN
ncbi:MAG: hypothetical protein E3J73_00085 [Candidatus Bathyarchaeum sp.]|nr:MAG: hypothetical protein E3J73_00085 [Candidatus Bathyarchaeum sp.]